MALNHACLPVPAPARTVNYNARKVQVKQSSQMGVILEIILDVLGSILGSAFDEWYDKQRWWVRGIVISTVVFFVLTIVYFAVILPILHATRGGS